MKYEENMRCNSEENMQNHMMISRPARKILLIISIMLLALLTLVLIIQHSKKLAETDSEATVYGKDFQNNPITQ